MSTDLLYTSLLDVILKKYLFKLGEQNNHITKKNKMSLFAMTIFKKIMLVSDCLIDNHVVDFDLLLTL